MTRYDSDEYSVLPLDEEVLSENYFILLGAIISDYFSLVGKPKTEQMFYRRCMNEGKKETLYAIARDFNITRERVRQIVKLSTMSLQALFVGKHSHHPNCRVKVEALQKIATEILKHETPSKIILKSAILKEAETALPEEFRGYSTYAEFFLQSYGYEQVEISGEIFYTKDKTALQMPRWCKDVKSYITAKATPVTVESIAESLKLPAALIETTLSFIKGVEYTEDRKVLLSIDSLKLRADKAYCILQRHGKPMHHTEIVTMMGENILDRISIRPKDKRLTFIGKTGLWSLTEWQINRDTIIDLIKKALGHTRRPTEYKDIVTYIHLARPDLTYRSIVSTIKAYRDLFVWTDERTIGLKSWKAINGITLPKKNRGVSVVDGKTFAKTVIDIFLSQGKPREISMTYMDLRKRLETIYPNEKHLELRCYNMPILIKNKDSDMTRFMLDPDYEIIQNRKSIRRERINKFAEELLNLIPPGEERLLSDIINQMEDKGYPSRSTYFFISRGYLFRTYKKNPERRIKYITRKENGIPCA